MNGLLLKPGELALLVVLSLPLSGQALGFAAQETDIKTAKKTQAEALKRSELMKPHFANGNQAMQEAQATRQQLQTASNDQKSELLAKMKADYQTAITEYEQALQETEVRDENGLQVIGLIGVIRNGLVSQQKAVEMLGCAGLEALRGCTDKHHHFEIGRRQNSLFCTTWDVRGVPEIFAVRAERAIRRTGARGCGRSGEVDEATDQNERKELTESIGLGNGGY